MKIKEYIKNKFKNKPKPISDEDREWIGEKTEMSYYYSDKRKNKK